MQHYNSLPRPIAQSKHTFALINDAKMPLMLVQPLYMFIISREIWKMVNVEVGMKSKVTFIFSMHVTGLIVNNSSVHFVINCNDIIWSSCDMTHLTSIDVVTLVKFHQNGPLSSWIHFPLLIMKHWSHRSRFQTLAALLVNTANPKPVEKVKAGVEIFCQSHLMSFVRPCQS